MASNLKTFTDYDTLADKYIELVNARCARAHGIAAVDWTRLRVGFRVSVFDNPHVSITGTPELSFGFCSGNTASTDVYPAGSAPHCFGFLTDQATWSTSGSIYPHQSSADHYALTVDGSTALHAGADSFASIYMPNYDTTGWTSWVFLEIEKTAVDGSNLATECTIRHTANNSSPTYHKDKYEFRQAMEMDDITDIPDNEADLKAGITVDEATNGEFDSIYISWDQTDATLKVHGAAVAIMDA